MHGKLDIKYKVAAVLRAIFFCFADWIVFRIALVLYVQLDVSIVA